MRAALLITPCLLLASCNGYGSISGIYSATSNNEVDMIQLVETPQHHLTGRFETATINQDGTVADNAMAVEGDASGSQVTLLFKPIGFINAGITATGQIDGNQLTISGRGLLVKAQRTTLDSYQAAMTKLQSAASTKYYDVKFQAAQKAQQDAAAAAALAASRKIAADAATAAQQAQALADAVTKIKAATGQLKEQEVAMDNYVAAAPDFEAQYRANTDRVSQLRGDPQQAGLVIQDTHLIAQRKNAYGNRLGQMAEPAAQLAGKLKAICDADTEGKLSAACPAATGEVAAFSGRIKRYKAVFSQFDAAFKENITQQIQMIRQQ